MKDIDLFAHNDSAKPIKVGPVMVRAKGSVSVQVKRWAEGMRCPEGVDCLVGIGVEGSNTLNSGQLLAFPGAPFNPGLTLNGVAFGVNQFVAVGTDDLEGA